MHAPKKPQIGPRIAIDARMVSPVPHGIARYVTQIAQSLRNLSQHKPIKYDLVFLVPPGLSEEFLHQTFAGFEVIEAAARFLSLAELREIPLLLKKVRADLYHSTSFSSLIRCPCPHLVTIHDLNHLTFGSWDKRIYYWIVLKRFARRAKAVLTVSEFSKMEISDWLWHSRKKIDVVYNAIPASIARLEASFGSVSGSRPGLRSEIPELQKYKDLLNLHSLETGKYFFCLSNPKPHKNVSLLVHAYEEYRTQVKDPWPLVLSMKEFATKPGIVALGNLTDGETSFLLSQCGGMFFPSLYEGFGLPPVEAAISGVRLAISRIPPHVEGLMDLDYDEVVWVDPMDWYGWIQAFRIVQEGQVRIPSDAHRQKILARYSSARMGQDMDQIYRRVLGIVE